MYQRNQLVEAYYDDGWYSGTIHKMNEDETYVIHFDDGDVADDIRFDEIRLPQEKPQGGHEIYQDDDDDDPFGDEFKPQSK
jgi:carotenoid cleavage dioxygenase-like enzyme